MSNSNILDERYVVQPSAKFSPGEVFKIYWSEPLGAGRTQTATEYETRSHLGQKFYFGFRRFIVIANDEGHCTCVPILTYEQRGCTKRGVKPSKHGIVYAKGGQPLLLEREPNLGFDPVQLVLDYGTEKIAKESRINYAKLVTVEHNVKVFFIGRIVQSDFVNIVTGAVDKCWMVKNRR
ncbi:hypothetical protein B0T17DRAFT_53281 [Bombardia bombarda]|uniref:DUF6590 domain-containing protein n=1 Tax=Bombardia bombarda TaxID=252184 RepID=A0AA39XKH9_9PEZI|nr:hypothetical protein B0T17DRAFT_53281 [Bombardia bombarda]